MSKVIKIDNDYFTRFKYSKNARYLSVTDKKADAKKFESEKVAQRTKKRIARFIKNRSNVLTYDKALETIKVE